VRVHVEFEVEQPLGRIPNPSQEFDDCHNFALREERQFLISAMTNLGLAVGP